MVSKRAKASGSDKGEKRVHGRTGEGAFFSVPPAAHDMPHDYALILEKLKTRIQEERLRIVLSANAAMVLLYWDIGQVILGRQQREGWGAKVIDRLSVDLRQAFPDMRGLSPRNLKYMRAFASAWPERQIVQEVLAQITWYHNIALLEKLDDAQTRLWYVRKAIANGWSHSVLAMQIESAAHEREGKAITNFPATLPPPDSDMAAQVFKDPYLFDFLGTADLRREKEVEQALMDHIQRFLLELGVGFAFVGRQVHDVHEKNFGYDLTSLDLNSGELRLIEVKGIGESTGSVLLTPNEKRVAEDRRDCYWLYVVTDCKKEPHLQNPIKDPARLQWHEVKKVDHYWLKIDAVAQPMIVREGEIPYGEKKR